MNSSKIQKMAGAHGENLRLLSDCILTQVTL